MSDLIRKEDALMCARPEYLNPNQEKLASYNQGWNNAIEMYYRQIAELPTAEPKVGKWLDGERVGYNGTYYYRYCSECLFERNDDDVDKDTPYCPECGTKMGGK